jgi:general secretion pathway protein K
MMKIHSYKGGRGSALVITLLVIATLTGLTLAFSEESSTELNLAGFAREGYRAYQIASSGVNIALGRIAQDEDREMDSLREDWSQAGVEGFREDLPEEISVSGGVVDENSKININLLINENGEEVEKGVLQLKRLFKVLGLEEELVYPILDWLDSDDEERLDGAETFYYQSLEEPYGCANSRFLTVDQIYLVKGFRGLQRLGEKGEKRLSDFLTVYSDGKININTASSEVLQSLHDEMIDGRLAQAIIDYRREEDFLNIGDLQQVTEIDKDSFDAISEWTTVKSSAFSITCEVKSQEAVSGINAVALRDEDEPVLIYWRVL